MLIMKRLSVDNLNRAKIKIYLNVTKLIGKKSDRELEALRRG